MTDAKRVCEYFTVVKVQRAVGQQRLAAQSPIEIIELDLQLEREQLSTDDYATGYGARPIRQESANGYLIKSQGAGYSLTVNPRILNLALHASAKYVAFFNL